MSTISHPLFFPVEPPVIFVSVVKDCYTGVDFLF